MDLDKLELNAERVGLSCKRSDRHIRHSESGTRLRATRDDCEDGGGDVGRTARPEHENTDKVNRASVACGRLRLPLASTAAEGYTDGKPCARYQI